MMIGIYCLMTAGRGLTNEIRTLLYDVACEMFKKGAERESVKSPDCEAVIRTKFEFALIGSISGRRFTADVETENGKTHTDFIVHDRDLENPVRHVAWVAASDFAERYQAANTAWLN